MSLEIRFSMEHAHNVNVLGFDSEKDHMGLIRKAIEPWAQVVARHTNARELRKQFKTTFQRKVLFESLSEAEGLHSVVADRHQVGDGFNG